MCESGEYVLSDVHVDGPSCSQSQLPCKMDRAITRFYFTPTSTSNDSKDAVTMATTVDEDGDLVVTRRKMVGGDKSVLVIEHAMATTLEDVGLQVWQGCLLLCDYLLSNRDLFNGCRALELGAGVGLATIVMSMMASYVFCTDVGTSILETCTRNIETNVSPSSNVHVRELDWLLSPPTTNTDLSNSCDEFRWKGEDFAKLKEVNVFIAADVVYDNNLTDAFFATLRNLMTTGNQDATAYIAIERRLNFTLDDLMVTCKAYNHYHQRVTSLPLLQSTSDVVYSVQKLPTDFPKYFQYTRTEQLELWKISAVKQKLINS